MKRCYRENMGMIDELKEMDYTSLVHNLQQDALGEILERLRQLDYANPNVLEQLYRYLEKTEDQQQQTQQEVIKEFKEGQMDPSSEVAKFEKIGRSNRGGGAMRGNNKRLSEIIIAKMQLQKNAEKGVEFLRLQQ